jgi:hypothetical protein
VYSLCPAFVFILLTHLWQLILRLASIVVNKILQNNFLLVGSKHKTFAGIMRKVSIMVILAIIESHFLVLLTQLRPLLRGPAADRLKDLVIDFANYFLENVTVDQT